MLATGRRGDGGTTRDKRNPGRIIKWDAAGIAA